MSTSRDAAGESRIATDGDGGVPGRSVIIPFVESDGKYNFYSKYSAPLIIGIFQW